MVKRSTATQRRGRPTGRRQIRSTLRHLSRAILGEPTKFRPPTDPPAVTRTYTHSTTMQIAVKIAETTGFDNNKSKDASGNSAFFGCAVDSTTKALQTCFVSVDDLYELWCIYTRTTPLSVDEVEISLIKVAMWGPPAVPLAGTTIGLTVDNQAPFSSLQCSDTGTSLARARCGITLPFRSWNAITSLQKIIGVDPDHCFTLAQLNGGSNPKVGTIVGSVQVTVSIRLTAQ